MLGGYSCYFSSVTTCTGATVRLQQAFVCVKVHLLSRSCSSLQTLCAAGSLNTTPLTQLQQLRRDRFTDPGASARHYRNFVVQQPRSEHTGRRHACFYTLLTGTEEAQSQQRPLLDVFGRCVASCFGSVIFNE